MWEEEEEEEEEVDVIKKKTLENLKWIIFKY